MVTARETVGLVTARWQECVKNGATAPIDDYPHARGAPTRTDEWDWGTIDLADVLARWGRALPPERVHVLTLPEPRRARADELWRRFAGLLGIDPDSLRPRRLDGRTSPSASSRSSCCAGSTPTSTEFGSALDRGVWIRGYLAQGKLVPRGGEKFWPSDGAGRRAAGPRRPGRRRSRPRGTT